MYQRITTKSQTKKSLRSSRSIILSIETEGMVKLHVRFVRFVHLLIKEKVQISGRLILNQIMVHFCVFDAQTMEVGTILSKWYSAAKLILNPKIKINT